MDHPVLQQFRTLLEHLATDIHDLPDAADKGTTHIRGPRILRSGKSRHNPGMYFHLEGAAAKYRKGTDHCSGSGGPAIEKYENLVLTCYLREVLERDPRMLVFTLTATVPMTSEEKPSIRLQPGEYDPLESAADCELRVQTLLLLQAYITTNIAPAYK